MNLLTVFLAFALLSFAGAVAYRRRRPERVKVRVLNTPSKFSYD